MVGWRVGTARGVMVTQAVASAGIWVVQVLTVLERLDHGQDVPGAVWLVLVVNPVIAVLVAVAAAMLTRQQWAKPLAVGLEVIGALCALISVLTGYYQAVIAILLAFVVIALIVPSRLQSEHVR
ncbi:hypothetical protein VSH64_19600 [Amycolatopsis rhabdoformis]|uniref:Uncharacterized protein n=1 Tax=Amycolatopsis rhabdoformis TaxID=1448059 RepID=A0ABZ1IK70_9PSEU|nr:hypothetical protein [Amycolatopsis rhabdoformis]WSE34271.1 hypothetical protein VSH64_19600 [Amycolatopsis rhabdoformis]